MRFVTIRKDGAELAGVVTKNGVLPVKDLNRAKGTAWEEELFSLIEAQQIPRLTAWYNAGGREELEKLPGMIPKEEAVCAPLYRNPKRIFGIGLNYADHAADIGDAAPKGFPGSFFKMPDTLIGYGDEIHLPKMKEAQRTTAEAELGIIMGKDCRDVDEEHWEETIVGCTTILDMTEESILKGNDFVDGNPRYLCIAKNFPTSSIRTSQPQTSRTKIIPSCTWQRLRMHTKLSENSKDQNRHSALQRNGGSVSIWPNIC